MNKNQNLTHQFTLRKLVCALVTSTVVVGVLLPVTASAVITTKKAAPKIVYAIADSLVASQTARAQHHRVQILNDNTPTSTTYANKDGSYTTTYHSEAIRAVNANGEWVGVSTRFMDFGGRVVVAGANPLNPTFGTTRLPASPLITVGPPQAPFTMQPVGVASGINASAHQPVARSRLQPFVGKLLPLSAASTVGVANNLSTVGVAALRMNAKLPGVGDEVVYRHVVGATKLSYTLGNSSLTEAIVIPTLKDAGAGRIIQPVPSAGLTVSEE